MAESATDGATPRRTEDDERVPHEVAKRLFADESPVRVWREYRTLSQRALAARAGLAPSYLSAIESGRKPGSVAAYKALAEALDLAVDDLV